MLEWVLFETGPFAHETDAAANVRRVPCEYFEEKKVLATRWGRLMHELLVAPVPVLVTADRQSERDQLLPHTRQP